MPYIISRSITSNGIILEKNSMTILDGGIANSTTVGYRGSMFISSNGTANNTTLNSGAKLTVFSGGTANQTTVNSSGMMRISSGGMANSTTVSSYGSMVVWNVGTANSTTVYSGGSLLLSEGTAINTVVSSGGEMGVFSGGIANDATIYYGGSVYVTGGTANDITISSGGIVSIASSNATILTNGSFTHISNAGTATNAVVDYGGILLVGGEINNTTVKSGGMLTVTSGGTACNTLVSSGGIVVASGDMVSSTTVHSGGSLSILTGVADKIDVGSGGDLYVAANRYVTDISAAKGAVLEFDVTKQSYIAGSSNGQSFLFDGKVSDCTIDFCRINLMHTTANNIIVNSGGNMLITSGEANNITVNRGGAFHVLSGGMTDSAIVSCGGILHVASKSVASNTVINSGGSIQIDSGGSIVSATVQRGGILTGYFNYSDITYNSGSTLYFCIADLTPENSTALVNITGFSEPQDKPSCAILVSDSQKNGTYRLASGARDFNQSITVMNSTIQLGTLSMNQTVEINGRDYTLSLDNDDLLLSISTHKQQYIYLDFDGENSTAYNNPELNASLTFSVQNPNYSEELKQTIISELAKEYENEGIIFTLERPVNEEYSTLYFGQTDAFNDMGDLFGIAETHDGNNQVKNDNAFILLDQSYSTRQILLVASHLVDHLLGFSSLSRGSGLRKYAETKYLLSTEWNQNEPYNQYCPTVDGDHCPTGCVNTAVAQIINYWIEKGMLELSLSLDRADSYYRNPVYPDKMIDDSDFPELGYLSFNETNKLLANYTIDDDDSIAALCFAVGVVQGAYYGIDETSTSIGNTSVFYRSGFKETINKEDVNWVIRNPSVDAIILDLLRGCPVFISSQKLNHALVIDGYDSSTDMFHLNFGWGGRNNGWYTLEQLLSYNVDMVLSRITPEATHCLDVKSLLVDGKTFYLNDEVTLRFSISNEGNEFTVPSFAYFYSGDTLLGSADFGFISPGYSRDVSFTVRDENLQIGENVITVKLDSQNGEGTISSADVSFVYSDTPASEPILNLLPTNLVGTADGVSWDSIGADYYLLEYSQDDFAHVLVMATPGTAVDTLNLPGGTYQWRVKDADDFSDDWAVGEPITSENDPGTAKVLQADGDGNYDLFLANPCGVWEAGYFAQHVGSVDDWDGTQEYAAVTGKNKLADFFVGSDDLSILYLTDDANGDALFVDDIYTELPGTLKEQQARIAQISDIRGGAGDDIIDMTSQRFEYVGDGLTIRGGDGNDVLWANKGENWLFGDAGDDRITGASGDDVIVGGIGNDRMHGGGGDDVFTFCENWGTDTVKQLGTGTVTLWFESGSIDNWDEETLTYSDGTNSVKVSGVTAEQVTLKFGAGTTPDDADQFASLSNMGAFEAFTTRKIFEEAATGVAEA